MLQKTCQRLVKLVRRHQKEDWLFQMWPGSMVSWSQLRVQWDCSWKFIRFVNFLQLRFFFLSDNLYLKTRLLFCWRVLLITSVTWRSNTDVRQCCITITLMHVAIFRNLKQETSLTSSFQTPCCGTKNSPTVLNPSCSQECWQTSEAECLEWRSLHGSAVCLDSSNNYSLWNDTGCIVFRKNVIILQLFCWC